MNTPEATPPKAAEAAASGKSEREILLERQNTALKTAAQRQQAGKRKAEEAAAHALREVEKAKQTQQAAKEKFSWMGYSS